MSGIWHPHVQFLDVNKYSLCGKQFGSFCQNSSMYVWCYNFTSGISSRYIYKANDGYAQAYGIAGREKSLQGKCIWIKACQVSYDHGSGTTSVSEFSGFVSLLGLNTRQASYKGCTLASYLLSLPGMQSYLCS